MGGTTDVTAFVPIGMNAVLFLKRIKELKCFLPLFSARLEEPNDLRFTIDDWQFVIEQHLIKGDEHV